MKIGLLKTHIFLLRCASRHICKQEVNEPNAKTWEENIENHKNKSIDYS